MSGPVDVMEWMRQCAPDEVLAAVAELIAALRTVDEICQSGLNSSVELQWEASLQDAMSAARAALARVQGGAE